MMKCSSKKSGVVLLLLCLTFVHVSSLLQFPRTISRISTRQALQRLPRPFVSSRTASASQQMRSKLHMTSQKDSKDQKNVFESFLQSMTLFFEELFPFISKNQSTKTTASQLQGSSSNQVKAVKRRTPSSNNAVLVFGGTGKTGQSIVEQLLQSSSPSSTLPSRDIILCGRQLNKVESFAQELQRKYPTVKDRIFVYDQVVDVTNATTLTTDLFTGVSQVVLALGPVFNDPFMTSEKVDYIATKHIVEALQTSRKSLPNGRKIDTLISLDQSTRNLSQWKALDDVIMGGNSQSYWEEVNWNGEGSRFARWTGTLKTAGGGFCGTVARPQAIDATSTSTPVSIEGYDGIYLRIRGDGHRFKCRVKLDHPDMSRNEFQYQAIFDTIANQWMNIYLPFDQFVAVRRNDVMYRMPKIQDLAKTSSLASIGLVYSKFTFNERENENCEDGTFFVDMESMGVYRNQKPEIVMISSAGSERINKITQQESLRDIPIVQLNPQGILNWKYKGEEIIRSAGLPYAIVRAVGLANVVLPDPTTTATPATAANTNASTATATPVDILLQPRKLEFNQGDIISGRIRRDELASVVVQALNSGEVIGKTFEVRRDESPSGQLQDTNWNHINGDIYQDQQNFGQLFRELQLDEDRAVAFQSNENNAEMTLRGSRFLPPFPYANDPFPPLVSFPPPPPPVVVANTAPPSVASPSNDASAK